MPARKLDVATSGTADSLSISEPMYWYLRGTLEQFREETGIDLDIDSDAEAEIEGGCLLELFLALEPIAAEVRHSTAESIQEVGLVEERNQIMMYQTPRTEGLATIENLMERANNAYNEGSVLKIRGAPETN